METDVAFIRMPIASPEGLAIDLLLEEALQFMHGNAASNSALKFRMLAPILSSSEPRLEFLAR
jgi:hypothetical protein